MRSLYIPTQKRIPTSCSKNKIAISQGNILCITSCGRVRHLCEPLQYIPYKTMSPIRCYNLLSKQKMDQQPSSVPCERNNDVLSLVREKPNGSLYLWAKKRRVRSPTLLLSLSSPILVTLTLLNTRTPSHQTSASQGTSFTTADSQTHFFSVPSLFVSS